MEDINSRPKQRSQHNTSHDTARTMRRDTSTTNRQRSASQSSRQPESRTTRRSGETKNSSNPNLTLLPREKRERGSASGSLKEKNASGNVRLFDRLKSKVDQYSNQNKKEEVVPGLRLKVSLGVLVEVEIWAEKARHGTTRNAFTPIMNQVEVSGTPLDDAVHSLTLAQIMPYDEMIRKIRIYDAGAAVASEYDFVYGLSNKYKTSMQNVVDRISHVRRLTKYYDKHGYNKLEEEIDD